ncbi:hypothetical protein Tco_1063705, partial [Tanacetum coccineum]
MRKSMEDLLESLQPVETLQWENILTVGSSSNSGNHSTNSGNPLAFYSQHKEQVKVLNEGENGDLRSKDKVSDTCAQSVEIDFLKQTLSEHLKEKESLLQT